MRKTRNPRNLLALAGMACLLTAAAPAADAVAVTQCVDLSRIIMVHTDFAPAAVATANPLELPATEFVAIVVWVKCPGIPGVPSPLNPEGCTMTFVSGSQKAGSAHVGGTNSDLNPARTAAFGLASSEQQATHQLLAEAPSGPLAAAHAYGDRVQDNAIVHGDALALWALGAGPQAADRAQALARALSSGGSAFLNCI